MNIRHLYLIILLGSVLNLPAQPTIEIPQDKQPLVTKVSASWCPRCGSWGWQLMEGLIEDNQASANLITAHYSGDYRNDAAAALASNFNIFSQPQFFVNSEYIPVAYNNFEERRPMIKEAVTQSASQIPLAQTGLLAGTDGEQLNIATRTRFFQDTEGTYNLGIYLLQRSFVGYQAGYGNDAEHKNVLRGALTQEIFGEMLATGVISSGTEVSLEISVALEDIAYPMDNIQILTVIWKNDDGRYDVVNSNTSDELLENFTLTNIGKKSAPDFSAQLAPNITTGDSRISLSLPTRRKHISVELWSADGRLVQVIFQGGLPSGEYQWTISRSNLAAAGLYWLRIHDGQSVISKRLIVK